MTNGLHKDLNDWRVVSDSEIKVQSQSRKYSPDDVHCPVLLSDVPAGMRQLSHLGNLQKNQ
jgi:hypothetical protein